MHTRSGEIIMFSLVKQLSRACEKCANQRNSHTAIVFNYFIKKISPDFAIKITINEIPLLLFIYLPFLFLVVFFLFSLAGSFDKK